MAYQQTGPTFAFCGTFSGASVPASRWLPKFNHEMKGYRTSDGTVPPDIYLESLSILLTDDAADWAENHLDAVRLLAVENPTQQIVDHFWSLLCERFSSSLLRSPLMSNCLNYIGNLMSYYWPTIREYLVLCQELRPNIVRFQPQLLLHLRLENPPRRYPKISCFRPSPPSRLLLS